MEHPTGLYPLTEAQLKEAVNAQPDVEWRYEMRRQCQEIIPRILLGPFVVSKSLQTLKELGITHIVCIRNVKEAFSVKARFPDQFIYLELDVEDNEDQNLITVYPRARDFILHALASEDGKVLVHCNSGISLSPAFIVMFVMEQYRMSWEDALQMVQNKRYCISPNGGFLTQIKEYESIYRAKIAVMSNPAQNRMARRKREEDSDDDEDRKRQALSDSQEPRLSIGASGTVGKRGRDEDEDVEMS